jgi:hypothetical protein
MRVVDSIGSMQWFVVSLAVGCATTQHTDTAGERAADGGAGAAAMVEGHDASAQTIPGECSPASPMPGSEGGTAGARPSHEDSGPPEVGQEVAEPVQTPKVGESDGGTRQTEAGGSDGIDDHPDAGFGPPSAPHGALQCRPKVDGDRLKALRLLGDDGSVLVQGDGWFDTKAAVQCEIEIASDGVRRCLPALYTPGVTVGTGYADAECTRPVAISSANFCPTTPIRYSVVEGPEDESCQSMRRVYELGDVVGAFDEIHYLVDDGTCTTVNTGPITDFYEVVREVPPEEFVSVDAIEVVGDRLQDVRRTLSDGATEYAEFLYDSERETLCNVFPAANGARACVPAAYHLVGAYKDAACTQGLTDTQSRCPLSEERRQFGRVRDYALEQPGVCGTEFHIYEPGTGEATTYASTFHWDSSSPPKCVELPASNIATIEVGAEIPREEFPSAVVEPVECDSRFVAGTRLQTLGERWNDGALDTVGFYDSEMHARCRRATASDGKQRCLPGTLVTVAGYFVDAECARPAAAYLCPADAGDLYDEREYAAQDVELESADGCPLRGHTVYSLTGPELATAYAWDGAGNCVEADANYVVREVDQEIPPESFVEFQALDY